MIKKYKLAINENHFVIQVSIHSMFLQNLSSVLSLQKFAFWLLTTTIYFASPQPVFLKVILMLSLQLQVTALMWLHN